VFWTCCVDVLSQETRSRLIYTSRDICDSNCEDSLPGQSARTVYQDSLQGQSTRTVYQDSLQGQSATTLHDDTLRSSTTIHHGPPQAHLRLRHQHLRLLPPLRDLLAHLPLGPLLLARLICTCPASSPVTPLTPPQSLYIFLVLIISLIWTGVQPAYGGPAASSLSFSYFTILTYWGLAFYFLFAALHTLSYARTGTPLLSHFPRPLQALHSLLHSTITTYPFLVTAIFWAVLFNAWWRQEFHQWSNISEHALNSAFALFEILVPRTRPAPWIHALWLVVILALYLGLAYLTRRTRGLYVYAFLDPAHGTGRLVGYILGIAAGAVVVFALRQALVWGRGWVTETKMGRQGRFHGGGEKGQGDTEFAVVRPWEK